MNTCRTTTQWKTHVLTTGNHVIYTIKGLEKTKAIPESDSKSEEMKN